MWTRVFLLVLGVATLTAEPNEKTKRQIFREQVLPHSGGKIPESAFRTDRLALNKLQKLGVAVPDGVSLDTRHNSVVRVEHDPETEYSLIRIIQEDEGRYVPHEGRSFSDYPNTIKSTYLIRPPIGTYYIRPHIHRAVQGPPLKLGGASVHATGGHEPPGPTEYAAPSGSGHEFLQEALRFQGLHHRADPTAVAQGVVAPIPAPTPNPEHASYIAQAGLDAPYAPDFSSPGYTPSHPGHLSNFLSNGYSHTGLLQVTSPYRFYPYSFLNFPSTPYSGGNGALLNPDDLAFRLRRRVGAEEEGNHGEVAQESIKVQDGVPRGPVEAPVVTFECDVPGREIGKVYTDPMSGCKKQYICLEDGRAAAYVCPDGSVFDHHAGKCTTRKYRRRRVKLDVNCNPMS